MGRYHNLEEETKAISRSAIAVVPSDTEDLAKESALYVGFGGSVTVDMANGEKQVTFHNVADSTFLPIVVIRVYATGTVATGILAIN